MTPKNAHWKYLWHYVHLLEDEESGLRAEPGDETGLLEHEDGAIDPVLDGNEDGEGIGDREDDIGDFPFEDEESEAVNAGDVRPDENAFGLGITEPETREKPIPGFEIIRHENGTIDYVREFDSWWSFAQAASDQGLAKWSPTNRASQTGEASWTGTKSFNEAVEMALRRGWPEGRELLNDSLVAVRPRPKVYESLEFEVAGAFPCVPVYCAGDPAWMISDPGSSIRAAKPIIRIDYNHWVHAGVDIKSMMLRGAAIVSLADSLERQGFSVELRIIGNSQEFMGRKTFRYSITYKKAGEPLDLDRAAFAIAHPSSMRRLAFAILEQHKELEQSFRGNYGSPLYEANPSLNASGSLDAMTVLFVPGPRGRETPDSANKAVTKAAEKLLNQLEQKDLAA